MKHEVIPQRYFLFCDESGNAGANYLDIEQPFHVAAGLLVPERSIDPVRAIVRSAIARGQAAELKGSRMLRSRGGQRDTLAVLGAVAGVAGVIPLFVAGERRYCIAGKAVETLLDPFTNPSAHWLPNHLPDVRESAWESVSDLPDEVLCVFAEAYEQPTRDGLADAARALSMALVRQGQHRLASSFGAAVHHIDAILEEESMDGVGGFKHGHYAALNLPMFLHVAKLADRLVEARGNGRIEIVHDEITWFDQVFGRGVSSLSAEGVPAIELPRDDGSSIRMNLTRVRSYSVAKSVDEPCIQVADLIAAVAGRMLKDGRLVGASWSSELREVGQLVTGALFVHPPIFAALVASRRTKAMIAQALSQPSG